MQCVLAQAKTARNTATLLHLVIHLFNFRPLISFFTCLYVPCKNISLLEFFFYILYSGIHVLCYFGSMKYVHSADFPDIKRK